MRIFFIGILLVIPSLAATVPCLDQLDVPDEMRAAKKEYFVEFVKDILEVPNEALMTNGAAEVTSIVQGKPFVTILMTPSEIDESNFSLDELYEKTVFGYTYPVILNDSIMCSMFIRKDAEEYHGTGVAIGDYLISRMIKKNISETPWVAGATVVKVKVPKEASGKIYSDIFVVFVDEDRALIGFDCISLVRHSENERYRLFSVREAKRLLSEYYTE